MWIWKHPFKWIRPSPLPLCSRATFQGQAYIIIVDRNIIQRLISAYRAGREVNLENVIRHSLMTVPLYLVTTSSGLHSTNKAVLANILTQHVQTHATVILDEPSCLLIDGQALVMALGKPPDIRTFSDYPNIFASTVFQMGANCQRIDVVFGRYHDESINEGSMTKRKQRHRPVRRKIENNSSVPLHHTGLASWHLSERKQISLYYFQTIWLNVKCKISLVFFSIFWKENSSFVT